VIVVVEDLVVVTGRSRWRLTKTASDASMISRASSSVRRGRADMRFTAPEGRESVARPSVGIL
jgi:hypothetical protein